MYATQMATSRSARCSAERVKRMRQVEPATDRIPPQDRASRAVVARYKRLRARDDRLVDADNAEVGQRNAIIESECFAP
jgi:hypothetical protein